MEGGVIGERVKLCEIAGVLCIGQNQLNIGNSVSNKTLFRVHGLHDCGGGKASFGMW